MALQPPAPGKAAGRAEDREVVAVGIAEGALALAQHALDDAHIVERLQAALVQDRREQRARRLGLGRRHGGKGQALAAARDVVPVQPIIGVEGDQRLLALAIVEAAEEARRGPGDALAGIDGLGACAAERQERRGGQHHPPVRMGQVVVMMRMRMRMPAVVWHRALRQALLRPYFSEQP
jgi:hypothetical protein